MRLTTKGRFAVTAMIDLALQNGGEPVWEESYPQLMVHMGLVFDALGAKTNLDTVLFDC